MKLVFAWIIIALLSTNCANFYQYKYLKNKNSSKKRGSFKRDKGVCEAISQKRAGVLNTLTYAGIVPSDKITKLYEKCMYHKGWRKK